MLLRLSPLASRLLHWLLVVLLLVGQVGGWLHEWSHFETSREAVTAIADASPGAAGQGENDDVADRQCLLCLSYAVLALALLGVAFALALGAAGGRLPRLAFRPAPVFRCLVFSARGPPRLS